MRDLFVGFSSGLQGPMEVLLSLIARAPSREPSWVLER